MSGGKPHSISELPQTAPLFPIGGAILFPRSALPLNVFEPRYLNMVDDALAGDRVIGIIQPTQPEIDTRKPELAKVGTLGRITTFAETDDGRYLITLDGVCRFRVSQELPKSAPYRRAMLSYSGFEGDLAAQSGAGVDREGLRQAIMEYVKQFDVEINWDLVDRSDSESVVNAACILCPFDASAKQALLETPDLMQRCELLTALLQWGADGSPMGLQ